MAEVARLDFETIERPYITVNMAGDERRLYITFDSSDLELMGQYEDGGEAVRAFFAKCLGDVVYDLGDDQLGALFKAWNDQRSAIGAPDLGES